jgi:hypothetical protein
LYEVSGGRLKGRHLEKPNRRRKVNIKTFYNKYTNLLLQRMVKRPAGLNTVINISSNIAVLSTYRVGIRSKTFICPP